MDSSQAFKTAPHPQTHSACELVTLNGRTGLLRPLKMHSVMALSVVTPSGTDMPAMVTLWKDRARKLQIRGGVLSLN